MDFMYYNNTEQSSPEVDEKFSNTGGMYVWNILRNILRQILCSLWYLAGVRTSRGGAVPMLITMEHAQAVLDPYHPMFFEVVENAWAAWRRDHAPKFAGPRRALQVCMNELMEQDFRMRLGGRTKEVRMPPPHPESNRFWLEFLRLGVLVFMKKFKNAHQISNYPTAAADEFNGQRVLAGVPDLPRITLGYFVTKTADELAGIHVAFLYGKNGQWRAQWSYELRREPGPGGRIFVPRDQPDLPLAPAAVRLKTGRDQKKGNE